MSRPAAGLPRVVALLPTHNGQQFVAATIAALVEQTYPLEILISDDASTDATAQICARVASTEPRVRLLRQATRLGWVGNSNALLQAADGEYLFFAGHDDLVAPTYVDELLDALASDPSAVLAFADGEYLRTDGVAVDWSFAELDRAAGRLGQAMAIAQQRPNWPVPYRGLFRAAAGRRVGGLRRHLAGEFGADWPWLLHLSLLGRFVRVPRCLFRKVEFPGGLASTWSYTPWERLGVMLSSMHAVRRAGLGLADEARLHAQLWRSGADPAWKAIRATLRRRLMRLRGPTRPRHS